MENSYEVFESKMLNVNRIFDKLDGVFNMGSYIQQVAILKQKVEGIKNTKMGNTNHEYGDFIVAIGKILKSINEQFLPYYEIYLLATHTDNLLNNIDEDKYNDISKNTIKLIDCLNKIPSSDRNDCNTVVENAYKVIYKTIVNESILEKDSIQNYVLKNANEIIKAKLNTLIRNDIVANLSEEEVVAMELNHLGDNIGFSYITKDLIEKIGKSTMSDKHEEYLERKKDAATALLSQLDQVEESNNRFKIKKKESIKKLSSLRRKILLAHIKIIALIMVPVSVIGAGWALGGDEYKHTTITRNAITNEQIGKETIKYELAYNLYEVNIKKCSPWREKENGGYIRDVEEYEYSDKENSESINPEELMKSIKAKKTYTETKDILHEEDDMVNPEIIVTETIRDDNDYRKSVGTSIALALAFITVFVGTEFLISTAADLNDEFFGYTSENIKDLIRLGKEYRREFKGRITRRQIREHVSYVNDEIVIMRDDYKEIVEKYGVGAIKEESTPEQLSIAKKYVKIK